MLVNSGFAPPAGANVPLLVAAYRRVLANASDVAFAIAVGQIANGNTDPAGPKFSQIYMPSSAQIASLCRVIEEKMTVRLDHAALLIERPEARPIAPEPPEKVRRANLARIAALHLRAPDKVRGGSPHG